MLIARYEGLHGATIAGKLYDCTQYTTRGGTKINKSGVAPKVCRMLLQEGTDPATLITFYRDETPCFRPKPVGEWAGQSIVEGNRHSTHQATFKPHPRERVQ